MIEVQTPQVERLVERLSVDDAYSRLKQEYDRSTLVEGDAVLKKNIRDGREGVIIPVEEGDSIVGRVIAERVQVAADMVREPDQFDVEIQHVDDGISTQGHVRCVFGICTDYCALLCAALPIGAGAGCLATCLRYIAKWPIAVACGVICWAVGEGVCYPTCVNQTGHDQ